MALEVDCHNMKNDRLCYQELLEDFIQDARTIINNRGSNEISKGEKIIRYRSKKGEYVLSYYSISGKLTIEKNGRLLAYQQRSKISIGDKFVTQDDAALFRRAATYR